MVAAEANAVVLESSARRTARMLTRALLVAGVVAPIGYFALQVAAAQLYPGYDFRHQVASELGIAGNASAVLFNGGVFSLGVLYALGAAGAFAALRAERASIILAALLALCLLSHAASAINAALFPLPDPRHNPGSLQLGIFALPLLAPIAWLFIKRAPIARGVLWLGLLCFAGVAAIMSGMTPVDPRVDGGLWQRVAAVVVNLPVFVVCASLFTRAQLSSGETV